MGRYSWMLREAFKPGGGKYFKLAGRIVTLAVGKFEAERKLEVMTMWRKWVAEAQARREREITLQSRLAAAIAAGPKVVMNAGN